METLVEVLADRLDDEGALRRRYLPMMFMTWTLTADRAGFVPNWTVCVPCKLSTAYTGRAVTFPDRSQARAHYQNLHPGFREPQSWHQSKTKDHPDKVFAENYEELMTFWTAHLSNLARKRVRQSFKRILLLPVASSSPSKLLSLLRKQLSCIVKFTNGGSHCDAIVALTSPSNAPDKDWPDIISCAGWERWHGYVAVWLRLYLIGRAYHPHVISPKVLASTFHYVEESNAEQLIEEDSSEDSDVDTDE
jgi:hypothetical protein